MYKFLDLSQKDIWTEYLNKLPKDQQDIYFTPEYYDIYEKKGDGKAQCFVFERNGEIALYPFLINSVNKLGYKLDKEYFDIQGAYGYNGAVSNTKVTSFLNEFANCFENWCKSNNIIAEFIRFNPVFNNYLFSKWIKPFNLLDNVLIPLTNYEDIWKNSFHRKVREAVRKSNRQGLTYISFKGNTIPEKFFNAFIDIYYHMLDRNNADKSFYYNYNFFHQIKDHFPHNTLFCFALSEGIPVSTELILHKSANAYAFLGGTLSNHYNKSPNTFIQNEIVKDLLAMGLSFYNRGGGISRGDSLYLFKKSFSINTDSVFYIGKKVHNQNVYDEVIKQWALRFPEKVEMHENILLKYRT